MEALQTEYQKVSKASYNSKTLEQTQSILDALQKARDEIAADPSSSSITLAKLQNPVKASFDGINANLREIHGGHNKYTRALDKMFKDKTLPSSEIDALSPHPELINRAIYLHLLREGLFDVAATFHAEASSNRKEAETIAERMGFAVSKNHPLGLDKNLSDEMQRAFESMYHILNEMKEHHNLQPAISWAREHAEALEVRGSNLEFELCRLQYFNLFLGGGNQDEEFYIIGQMHALEYAKKEFSTFRGRYLRQIQQLLGAIAYGPNLEDSPYGRRFGDASAWNDVATSFTREFCSLLELSADSPLYIAATAGAIALPRLAKLQTIQQTKRTEWTSADELAIEIPLPPSYQFHPIFVCPVSKGQTTDANPPMLLPCGHVLSQESVQKLSKGTKFKCPYCPMETHPSLAMKIFF